MFVICVVVVSVCAIFQLPCTVYKLNPSCIKLNFGLGYDKKLIGGPFLIICTGSNRFKNAHAKCEPVHILGKKMFRS